MSGPAPSVRSLQSLVMGAFDLAGFVRLTQGLKDEQVADAIDFLYRSIAEAVAASGGRLVKYLGDGALAVWPEDRADAAIVAALELRPRVAAGLEQRGVRSELLCRFHHGEVMAGQFGPEPGYDVIGGEVFATFKLPARTLSVSAEAFRRLGAEVRARLKKHSAPVVYIPEGDPRP